MHESFLGTSTSIKGRGIGKGATSASGFDVVLLVGPREAALRYIRKNLEKGVDASNPLNVLPKGLERMKKSDLLANLQ